MKHLIDFILNTSIGDLIAGLIIAAFVIKIIIEIIKD